MKLIGITGKAHAGKDEIAKYMWSTHSFTRIALADPLKRAAQETFGLTQAQAYDPALKEVVIPYWGLSPRQMFQQVGAAMKKQFGEDVWVRRWEISYNVLRDTDHIVVPDVRFDYEAATFRSLGGVIVEVRRPGAGLEGAPGEDVSEAGLSEPPDVIIENSGTLVELWESVDVLIGSMQ